MQKWEYLHVYFANPPRAYFANGKQIAEQGTACYKILNRLGDEGWELVWSEGDEYILKRPKS